MNDFCRKRKGISLVEIVCALAVLSVITLVVVNLLQLGVTSNAAASKDFDLQSGARVAMETMTNKIRYSTAVFVIPESGFREDNLENGWDYVGVLGTDEGFKEIAMFQYVEDSDTGSGHHKKTVLLAAREDFIYDLEIKKQDESHKNRLIEYIFTFYQDGKESWMLGSEAEAMNSLQVVNWGTDANKGRAIAYQSTERDMERTIGRVALVLDVSGSMALSFDGTKSTGNERYNAMMKSALQLLAAFAEHDSIEVTIIPYSTTANFLTSLKEVYGKADYTFLNAQSNHTALRAIINNSGLKPNGGTNTGDGLRRVYHSFLEDDKVNSRRTMDHVILLSDGDMTFATMKELEPYTYGKKLTVNDIVDRSFYKYTGDTNTDYGLLYANSSGYFHSTTGEVITSKVSKTIENLYQKNTETQRLQAYNSLKGCIYGIGSTIRGNNRYAIDVYSRGYVKEMGEMLNNYGVTPYFVAVSSDVSTNGIQIVKDALGIDDASIYHPLSQDELLSAFESIGDAIINDLWFINGPSW